MPKHESYAQNSSRVCTSITLTIPTRRFERQQTRENVCGLCFNANCCTRLVSSSAFTKSKKVADTPVGKQVSQRMLRRQEWAR